jgi:thioredoxin 1
MSAIFHCKSTHFFIRSRHGVCLRMQTFVSRVFVVCVAVALIAAWRMKPKPIDANLARGEVLMFDANWCGACRAMRPVVAQLQGEGFDIREVDVDKNRADAMKFSVHSIPTFVLVRDGHEVRRAAGVMPAESVRQLWR